MKTISLRNKERTAQGKKITATDERYYRMASEQLFGELAFAMELEPSEVEKIVNDRMEI
jgi:CarD family transcriptional regulator